MLVYRWQKDSANNPTMQCSVEINSQATLICKWCSKISNLLVSDIAIYGSIVKKLRRVCYWGSCEWVDEGVILDEASVFTGSHLRAESCPPKVRRTNQKSGWRAGLPDHCWLPSSIGTEVRMMLMRLPKLKKKLTFCKLSKHTELTDGSWQCVKKEKKNSTCLLVSLKQYRFPLHSLSSYHPLLHVCSSEYEWDFKKWHHYLCTTSYLHYWTLIFDNRKTKHRKHSLQVLVLYFLELHEYCHGITVHYHQLIVAILI